MIHTTDTICNVVLMVPRWIEAFFLLATSLGLIYFIATDLLERVFKK